MSQMISIRTTQALEQEHGLFRVAEKWEAAWQQNPAVMLDDLRKLTGILLSLQAHFSEQQPAPQLPGQIFLREATLAVEKHLEEDTFDAAQLAKLLGTSPRHLHRKLKCMANLSPSLFIRSVRLRAAYELLARAADKPAQVAYRVGFKNPAFFSRCFKAQFGDTPSLVYGKIVQERAK